MNDSTSEPRSRVNTNELDGLRSAKAVRTSCQRIGYLARAGESRWFGLQAEKLDKCIDLVVQTCEQNYPDLDVPLHSRWRHFVVAPPMSHGKPMPPLVDLWRHYSKGFSGERAVLARSAIDLAFVSVLLDAGAGPKWRYRDSVTGAELMRSEGLAAASVDLFFNHLAKFSNERGWWIDQQALNALTLNELAEAFQHSAQNPLVGVEGRLQLLHGLATVLGESSDYDRPGDILDTCLALSKSTNPTAGSGRLLAGEREERLDTSIHGVHGAQLLKIILTVFSGMWPNGYCYKGVNLGDCGYHSALRGEKEASGIVAFHKLSQWLTYSLVEPLEWGGVRVERLDDLTGLPEYRNGGLLIDTGVLRPLHEDLLTRQLAVESEAVVEWRALTVCLLDEIAQGVRNRLGKTADELPLCAVLQGGTWAAGRSVAMRKRRDGSPPLSLAIDGTVF